MLLHKETSQLCHVPDSVSCCRRNKEAEFTVMTFSSGNKNICVFSVVIFPFPKSCLSQNLGAKSFIFTGYVTKELPGTWKDDFPHSFMSLPCTIKQLFQKQNSNHFRLLRFSFKP